MKKLTILLCLLAGSAHGKGTLTDYIRISSDVLGYDLQYKVYLPEGYEHLDDLPVLFVTDGPMYIAEGKVPRVTDRLIGWEKIEPIIAVYVDARDPDDPSINRRNQQFACNPDYVEFYKTELIPAIEAAYPVAKDRTARSILGVSFGGMNAACFGLMAYDTFSGIGMHSPANHPVEGLLPAYEKIDRLPLKIFLSTGTEYDNTYANRKFRTILKEKGYPLKYIEVRKRHDWDNWEPLIDDVLLFFYGAPDEP